MTDSNDDNPYAPPAGISGELPPEPDGLRAGWPRFLIALQSAVIAVGLVALFLKTESLIVSGGILVFVDVVLFSVGLRSKDRPVTWYAVSSFAFASFVFLLINLNEWGPKAAREPVIGLCVLYALAALPVGWWLIRLPTERAKKDTEQPWSGS